MKLLNINEIKSLATNKVTFERGLDYYEHKRINNFTVNLNDNDLELKASVHGSRNEEYNVEILIKETGKVHASCSCPAHESYHGCCKHIIAVLLENYYNKEELLTQTTITLKSKTDKLVSKMIATYASQGVKEIVSQTFQKKVKLIPALEYTYNKKLLISFTIGHVRPYVIKNLNKFYEDMKMGEIVEFGKSLTLLHDINSFEDESKPLVKFFLDSYYDYHFFLTFNQNYSYHSIQHDQRSLLLTPTKLDELFELYQNKTIQFNNHGNIMEINFMKGKPNITISINEQDGLFTISNDINHKLTLNGKDFSYLLIDNTLYQVDEEYEKNVGLFLDTIKQNKSVLHVSKDDMRAFSGNVLSVIKDHLSLDVPEDLLTEYEPIPLTSKLYIDMPEANLITAKLKFIYGDIEYDSYNDTMKSERNLKEELVAKHIVNKYFDVFSKDDHAYIITNNESIYFLYENGLNEISKYMEIFATDQFKNVFKEVPNFNISVKTNQHLLDIDINSNEFPLDELYDILDSYKHLKKYHRLKDGSFIGLQDNSLTDILQIIDTLDLNKQELKNNHIHVPKYRALFLDNVLKNSEQIRSERDNEFKSLVRDIKDVDDTTFDVPNNFNLILRNYQKTGFRWLKTLSYYGFGGILADDMGLGKTIQIISLIQSYLEENNQFKPSLVVSPASLVLNWENEINKFSPHIKVLTIIGTVDARKNLIDEINDYQIIITSYDYIKRDVELYQDKFFKYHIIDEAQFIKNHTTLNSKAVKQINSEIRFALTGTPIENNLSEIWSIFDFIMPGYLFSYRKFNSHYEVPISKNDDNRALEQLKRLVIPFVLRRLKKDVLKELPDKTETTMYVALKDEQRKLYVANLMLAKNELNEKIKDNGFNSSKLIVLALLTRLRQICCHPALYYHDYEQESAKLDACLDLIDTSIESGHKILLFSQFTSMLDIIKTKLEEKNISHYLLVGSTKKEERKRLVDEFNQDDTKVFLISLKAGGTGLNLTGADVVIHYDPWWNVSAENQATDRAHRIGQKSNVQVYKLIAKDTIEEKIVKLQENKLQLAESIIVKDEGIITKMTQDEILKLFE